MGAFACRICALDFGCHMVELTGAVCFEAADELTQRLEPLWAPGAQIILDLSGVTFADTCCLRALLLARRSAEAHGATLRLVGMPAWLRHWLRVGGVLELFDVRSDLPAASPAHVADARGAKSADRISA